MKLRKCLNTKNHENQEIIYTLKEICPNCSLKTIDAHYKFIKIKTVKDAPE